MTSPKKIYVAQPSCSKGNEENYLLQAFRSGWVSSLGEYVTSFEHNFAHYCDSRHGITTNTGTSALHIALAALDIGPGDEVIVPALTFIATINAVLYTGATPVVVDVDQRSWNISIDEIRSHITKKTKAIIPVHLLGNPADIDGLISLAEKHSLYIIEDAAEAHGALYNHKKVGGIGDIGCFSFYANKIITTGEGGMCVTNNHVLETKMRLLRDHGMSKEKKYWHTVLGFNYRITNLQAALGVAQLEQIDVFLDRRKKLSTTYTSLLSSLEGTIEHQHVRKEDTKAWWAYVVLVQNETIRNTLMDHLAAEGIETRPFFYPATVMPPYKKRIRAGSCINAESIAERGLFLPFYVGLDEDAVSIVCKALIKKIGS